jgi:DnaJ-class molecular chaperone
LTAGIAPLEIKALAKIIDELSYYQILHLESDASGSVLKRAYYSTSRTFHPDANGHLDEQVRENCTLISKRITEAYCVLKDPRKRKAYDERLDSGEGLRMQLAEAKKAHAKRDAESRQGKTAQGRQFVQKAKAEMERGDYASAVNNLQMALTFEPGSDYFKGLLEEARGKRG